MLISAYWEDSGGCISDEEAVMRNTIFLVARMRRMSGSGNEEDKPHGGSGNEDEEHKLIVHSGDKGGSSLRQG